MFILAFIHKKIEAHTPIHVLQFFLTAGGTSLLSIETDPVIFCKENDIPVVKTFKEKSVTFLEVDPAQIQKDTFYSFNEPNTEAFEVWRTFVWVGTPGSDPWTVNTALDAISFSGIKVSTLAEAVLRNVAYT
jgi:hypothetical protein